MSWNTEDITHCQLMCTNLLPFRYRSIIYIAVTPCMLYFKLLFCSRPRALAARVYYVKLLPTWNKDYPSVYMLWLVMGIATDCTQSLTTACFWILAWACEKVTSDLGLSGVFHWVPWFPQPLTTGQSRRRLNIVERGTITEIPNFHRWNSSKRKS